MPRYLKRGKLLEEISLLWFGVLILARASKVNYQKDLSFSGGILAIPAAFFRVFGYVFFGTDFTDYAVFGLEKSYNRK